MRRWLNLSVLSLKQVFRHRLRTILTVAGVATGMFLFTAVETMQDSLRRSTETNANDTTLVVYRENRYCPLTSRLPEHYVHEIRQMEGVREVIPIQITVNNCGSSLDVITFRGVPSENLRQYNPDLEVVQGSYEAWIKRSDGTLVGEHFAARRDLKPGDQFEAVGVRVHVNGVIKSPHPQDNNVAYVHLNFLQQASRVGLGTVTQFNVRVDSSDQLDAVAQRIDALFASDSAPTNTRPEKAFFAQTAQDLIQIIRFTRWLSWGAVLAVLGLVSNALFLIARGRMTETAIFQTLGFSRWSIGQMMVWEGLWLGTMGGLLGSGLATLFFKWKRFTFGNEGLTMALDTQLEVVLVSLCLSIVLGCFASIWPAYVASRSPLVQSLRENH
jgi:putative ABC transport system permease protein